MEESSESQEYNEMQEPPGTLPVLYCILAAALLTQAQATDAEQEELLSLPGTYLEPIYFGS